MMNSISRFSGSLITGLYQESLQECQCETKFVAPEINQDNRPDDDRISLSPEALELAQKTTETEDRNTLEEGEEVRELKRRDREVKAHEQAHTAAGGVHAGGITYTYQTGPDGQLYAVGGSVDIDTSEAATPEKTLDKAKTIRKAALAPSEPSAADQNVAASAAQLEAKARMELNEEQKQEGADQSNLNSTVQQFDKSARPEPVEGAEKPSNRNREQQRGYSTYASGGPATNTQTGRFLAAV